MKSSGTRILLVRHGETEWNRLRRFQGRSDLPLNPVGRQQSHALAMALEDESLAAIYSSPMMRAIETARIIADRHPTAPFIEEQGFIEMDLGDFEGMHAQHWMTHYPDFRKAWQDRPATVRLPGGECLADVQRRAVDSLERITRRAVPGSTLLICSHNFVIISILCYASGISLDRFWNMRQDPTGLNILYRQGKQYQVERVNDRSHLRKHDREQTVRD